MSHYSPLPEVVVTQPVSLPKVFSPSSPANAAPIKVSQTPVKPSASQSEAKSPSYQNYGPFYQSHPGLPYWYLNESCYQAGQSCGGCVRSCTTCLCGPLCGLLRSCCIGSINFCYNIDLHCADCIRFVRS